MTLVVRGVLVIAGIAGIVFGLLSMREFDAAQLLSLGVWSAGGVVAHDLVLAPVIAVVGVLSGRVVSRHWHVSFAVAFVVWGSLTLIALPALSGLGVRPDNPTLLDRAYLPAWLLLSASVMLAAPGYVWFRGRTRR